MLAAIVEGLKRPSSFSRFFLFCHCPLIHITYFGISPEDLEEAEGVEGEKGGIPSFFISLLAQLHGSKHEWRRVGEAQ